MKTQPKLEKGIPIPPVVKGARSKYPLLKTMEVGDSFFVRFTDGVTMVRLRSAVCHCARRTGRAFSVRAVDGGARIWRVVR